MKNESDFVSPSETMAGGDGHHTACSPDEERQSDQIEVNDGVGVHLTAGQESEVRENYQEEET